MKNLTLRTGGVEYHNKNSAPWLSTEIFVSGCYKNCPDCFNQELRSFKGNVMPVDYIVKDIIVNTPYKKVTFSGGEPFIQAEALSYIAEKLQDEGFHIVCYTGYTFEELEYLFPYANELLKYINVLVDGPFIRELLTPIDEDFKFVGSSNQRKILVKESIKKKKIILYEEGHKIENREKILPMGREYERCK